MKKNQTIELPVLPLRGLMLFPNMVLHFDVGRKKSLAALEQGMMEKQRVFLISQKSDDTEDPGWKDLCKVGTIAEIKQVMNLPGENIRVLVEGASRGIIQEMTGDDTCMKAVIKISEDKAVRSAEAKRCCARPRTCLKNTRGHPSGSVRTRWNQSTRSRSPAKRRTCWRPTC